MKGSKLRNDRRHQQKKQIANAVAQTKTQTQTNTVASDDLKVVSTIYFDTTTESDLKGEESLR